MTDIPIPAATVLLLRDSPSLEVLMVERHANIGFAGGALVFPGGRIDPGDRNPAWAEHSAGCDRQLLAGEVAAIREAFEEAGILLARDASAGPDAPLIDGERAAALGEWRAVVEKDDAQFLELIRRENLSLACDKLCLFAHWIAPPGLHKRFDTLFFAAACPPGQEAREDGNEATEALWIAPEDAIAARQRGERKIIFPTLCNLRLLGSSTAVSDVFAFAGERKIAPIQPTIEMRDGAPWLCIPQDMGYPVTSEKIDASLQG